MKIFDRFNSKVISEKNLPNSIDLGRFFIIDSHIDLTNRAINVGVDKMIQQGILDNENKSLQDLFVHFHLAVSSEDTSNHFSVVPLIQSVKEKLYLNTFESLLVSKVFHLEEIFRNPHYLLERTIEKVNVARAKRIPARSYQNLASHTEDWLQKSIVNFKPRRILNEELDLDYNVYENQVTIALLKRCILYLTSRLKEVYDLSSFLKEYDKLLANRRDDRGWYRKTKRNLNLIGQVYEDDNYSGNESQHDVLTKTQEALTLVLKRLKALQNSSLCSEVNQRMVLTYMKEQSVSQTNVMTNHKHYRYVRELWMALNEVDHEKTEDELIRYEQDVIDGIRCYAKSILSYVVKSALGYELEGNNQKWTAYHTNYAPISFEESKDNILTMKIGDYPISFVVVGNYIQSIPKNVSSDMYVLSLTNQLSEDDIVNINPYDPDTIERVGKLIKTYLLRQYMDQFQLHYPYEHLLSDFVQYIPHQQITFHSDYTFSYKGLFLSFIDSSKVIEALQRDENFLKRSRPDKDKIKKKLEDLVDKLNTESGKLVQSIYCFDCFKPLDVHQLQQLSYIECDCGFVLDSSQDEVIFSNKNPNYSSLSVHDWGMDYIVFSKNNGRTD